MKLSVCISNGTCLTGWDTTWMESVLYEQRSKLSALLILGI